MSSLTIQSLVLSSAMITSFWMATTSISKAENLPNIQKQQELSRTATEEFTASPKGNNLIAQLFYPPVSSPPGVMVQGQGKASAPADTARIEFLFTNQYPEQLDGTKPKAPKPITQANLKPVVDALAASGVPASSIEVNTSPTASQTFPFPVQASKDTLQLVVKLEKPNRDRVQQIIKIAGDETILKGILALQNTNVEYAVNDCPALEKAAYISAVNNARSRALALSEALGVKIADIPSIAESSFSAFNFFGSSSSACGSQASPAVFPFNAIKRPYDPNTPAEVEVKKDIFVTYTIR